MNSSTLQSTAKKIKSTKDRVIELLKLSADYRDSDEKLVVRYWWDELERIGIRSLNLGVVSFLEHYAAGKITSADIITRARRKAQEQHPELRGATWLARHEEEEAVRREINRV